MAGSVGYFWTLQHAQLYTEPERLAKAGYVTETREERRAPAQALHDHRQGPAGARRVAHASPPSELAELREPARPEAVLRRRPGRLAAAQIAGQQGAARRVRGDPRLDAGRRAGRPAPGARGGHRASSAQRSPSGRSSRTRVPPPWPPPQSRAPPSCRCPAAARARRCSSTRSSPPRSSGPPAWFLREEGRLAWRKAFGLGVPKDQWVTAPIQCFLVEHPSAGPC